CTNNKTVQQAHQRVTWASVSEYVHKAAEDCKGHTVERNERPWCASHMQLVPSSPKYDPAAVKRAHDAHFYDLCSGDTSKNASRPWCRDYMAMIPTSATYNKAATENWFKVNWHHACHDYVLFGGDTAEQNRRSEIWKSKTFGNSKAVRQPLSSELLN